MNNRVNAYANNMSKWNLFCSTSNRIIVC